MPWRQLNDEDDAAYQLYLTLPAPIRRTVRAVVYLCRSDQALVRELVQGIWQAGGRQASARSAPRAKSRLRRVVRALRLVPPSHRDPAA